MKRTKLSALALGCSLATALAQTNALKLPSIADGPFKPEWNSLTNYQAAPEWYRDANFGIWAHWGPQCQPEHGDWYARGMYEEDSWHYKSHLAEYGHPSTNGFKDIIHEWKVEHFDPNVVLEIPKDGKVTIKSLAANAPSWPGKIDSVRLVGGGKLKFTRDADGLHVSLSEKFNGKIAFALKVRSGLSLP